MKTLIALLALSCVVALLPPSATADWTVTAGNATWAATGPLAAAQEARDAILWERMNRAFLGAVFTAATPNLSTVNNGDGTGTLRIILPRPAADTWLTQYGSNGGCGEAPTQQQLLECVDGAILADVKEIVRRYRLSQIADVGEADLQ